MVRALSLISLLSLGAAVGAQGTWLSLDGPADVNPVGGLLSSS